MAGDHGTKQPLEPLEPLWPAPCCQRLHHVQCPKALDKQKGVPLNDAVNSTMLALLEGFLTGAVVGALFTIGAYVWILR